MKTVNIYAVNIMHIVRSMDITLFSSGTVEN